MISVLIPVYNFDVTKLVTELHRQAFETAKPFEIIIYDDYSNKQFRNTNRSIKALEFVDYHELPQNVGRSKIRNLLADSARYDYYLFIDCDSEIISDSYFKDYFNYCTENAVVYGGRRYHSTPPPEEDFYLHWLYGKNREEIPAYIRQKKSNCSFMTNNFLVSKQIFDETKFDETLRRYGHEDTLFGLELQKRNIPVIHTDNPLIHAGLEGAQSFLNKTKQGIQNLRAILANNGKSKLIYNNIVLLRYYHSIKQLRMIWLIKILYSIFEKSLAKNILSRKPKLAFFDFYKLGYICSIR